MALFEWKDKLRIQIIDSIRVRNQGSLEPLNKALIGTCKEWERAVAYAREFSTFYTPKNQANVFYYHASTDLLAVMFYAAAVMDEDVRRVKRWSRSHMIASTQKEVESIVRWKENVDALDIWLSFCKKEETQKLHLLATIETFLSQHAPSEGPIPERNKRPGGRLFTYFEI